MFILVSLAAEYPTLTGKTQDPQDPLPALFC
jgi:hypothetical protein